MMTPIDVASLEYVCLNMRECDRVEIFALRPHDNPIRLAWEANQFILNHGRGITAWHAGRPAGVAAFTELWPGTWEAWMFGTNDFKHVAISLMRWVRTEANDILTTQKGNRLHCDCRVGNDEAHKMIQALGARPEVTLRNYGKDRSDYVRYVWLPGENDQVLRPHYTRAA
jgi:hypothetical protein